MNAPLNPNALESSVTLDDKYTLERGRAFITGTQALIRLPMLQRERDLKRRPEHRRLHHRLPRLAPGTSSTRPRWKAKKHLEAHHVVFHPGDQ
jgi:indolepyruvate ferredoxin oxidoreductase